MLDTLLRTCIYLQMLIPLAGTVILGAPLLFWRPFSETFTARLARTFFQAMLLAFTLAVIIMWVHGLGSYHLDVGHLVNLDDYALGVHFLFGPLNMVYLFVTNVVTNVIVIFSSRYLHREKGFQRYFAILMLFIFAVHLVVMAASLNLLFAGWELVGLASFLLISFYFERPTPVRNSLRAFFVYRVCDVGLLAGACLMYVIEAHGLPFSLMHENKFQIMMNHVAEWPKLCVGLLLVWAAIGKSAQFPFCGWLPRAMEGPTPSSAIFYGGLSVHLGVFLLLRTYHFWQTSVIVPWVVFSIGLISAIWGTLCGRVQSNVKGQIAYATITQIGVMFMELGLGLPLLAMVHMVSHIFLRCYQLLTSPSLLAEELQLTGPHLQAGGVPTVNIEEKLPLKVQRPLYLWSLHEGYLGEMFYFWLWRPFTAFTRPFAKLLSEARQALPRRLIPLPVIIPICGAGFAWAVEFFAGPIVAKSFDWPSFIAIIAIFTALGLSFAAWGERQKILASFHMSAASFVLFVLAVWLWEGVVDREEMLLYIGGFFAGWFFASIVLHRLQSRREIFGFDEYSGLHHVAPRSSFLLLIGSLCMMGFPIATTFIAEDLFLHAMVSQTPLLTLVMMFIFAMNGFQLLRIYTRIFWGPPTAAIPISKIDIPRAFLALCILSIAVLDGICLHLLW